MLPEPLELEGQLQGPKSCSAEVDGLEEQTTRLLADEGAVLMERVALVAVAFEMDTRDPLKVVCGLKAVPEPTLRVLLEKASWADPLEPASGMRRERMPVLDPDVRVTARGQTVVAEEKEVPVMLRLVRKEETSASWNVFCTEAAKVAVV